MQCSPLPPVPSSGRTIACQSKYSPHHHWASEDMEESENSNTANYSEERKLEKLYDAHQLQKNVTKSLETCRLKE